MDKNLLLIGGSHGIGYSIAELLHRDYTIFVASRTNKGLEGLNVEYIPFDATSSTLDTSRLPEEIHGFVYCPGSIHLKPLKLISIEAFEKDMHINFFSMVKVVKEIIPKMTDGGSIVLFSTVAVNTGMPFHTSIAAAKGAVEGFARSMAAEFAPKIRVNVIAPSLVDTPLAHRLLNNDKKREMMSNRHPLKRVGQAVDIGHIASFLLSANSSWMTGQTIGVDGGIGTLNIN